MDPTVKKYKRILMEIADNLTFSDVGSMKFVCRDIIGIGALDQVPNNEPLKMLKLLEERQIISEGNLTWLRSILKEIQRIDLVMKIPDEFCQQVDVVDSSEIGVVSRYRALLKAVADDLTSSNVKDMTHLLCVPGLVF